MPRPLLLDADGSLLGLPGIVTEFLPGSQIEPPTEAPRWADMAATNARMLAKIHQTPFSDADKPFMMNDDVEIAWFIKKGEIPGYMRGDPDGEMIWHLINDHWHQRPSARPRFQHTDYWSGNILWLGDKISAVVDWEEAGYGDPAGDVAYTRMEYFLEGLPEAAETFLRVYLAETGWQLANLPISELAASVRPMTDPRWLVHAAIYGRALPQVHRRCQAQAIAVRLIDIEIITLVSHIPLASGAFPSLSSTTTVLRMPDRQPHCLIRRGPSAGRRVPIPARSSRR